MLYFGRDPLGRRSLLVHYPSASNPYFLLASVSVGPSPRYILKELSTTHIHAIKLNDLDSHNNVNGVLIDTCAFRLTCRRS